MRADGGPEGGSDDRRRGGRVVVVTGASAGVGRAVARAFAARGDHLALLARGDAGLRAARAEALDRGARSAHALVVDVADPPQLAAAVREVDHRLGPVDVWVNDAMVSVFAPAWEITPAEYRRVTDVTYLGAVNGTLAALERMRPRDHGTIVIVGSALAYRGIPLQAPYCAAKHALHGFVESLRAELRWYRSNVVVTTVNLPAVNTPQFEWVRTRLPRHPRPVGPVYQPEVAARAVLWAAEHRPRTLDVGAPTVATRVLSSTVPGLLDRYLGRTGVASQQTGELVDQARWRDNLDSPVDDDRDHGAHGPFDDEARARSPLLWLALRRRWLSAAGLAAVTATALARRVRPGDDP